MPNQGDTGTPNINLKGKWLKEAGFETGVHLTVKIADGCIVIIKGSDEVDDLKHEKDALRQQLRKIKQVNKNIKSAQRGMTAYIININKSRKDHGIFPAALIENS